MKVGMVAANLTGGEAEELRKAMDGKRSDAILTRMRERLLVCVTPNFSFSKGSVSHIPETGIYIVIGTALILLSQTKY